MPERGHAEVVSMFWIRWVAPETSGRNLAIISWNRKVQLFLFTFIRLGGGWRPVQSSQLLFSILLCKLLLCESWKTFAMISVRYGSRVAIPMEWILNFRTAKESTPTANFCFEVTRKNLGPLVGTVTHSLSQITRIPNCNHLNISFIRLPEFARNSLIAAAIDSFHQKLQFKRRVDRHKRVYSSQVAILRNWLTLYFTLLASHVSMLDGAEKLLIGLQRNRPLAKK